MNRRILMTAVVLVGVATTIVLNQWVAPSIQQTLTSSQPTTQSSALYCTGLTSAKGGAFGEVVFVNTSDSARTLSTTVAALGAHGATVTSTMTISPYAQSVLVPTRVLAGVAYAVAATVSGGGVYAQEVIGKNHAEAPCQSSGVTQWFASGLSTAVGSSARLTMFNPTATNAVFGVKTYSSSGFAQPAPLQGISVPPHGLVQVDLGHQLVNQAQIGAEVDVLRGSLVVAADQLVGSLASINTGSTVLATSGALPLVPTNQNTNATVVFSNPSSQPAQVTLDVALGHFTIPTQTIDVASFSSTTFVVTPNNVIPAAGEAHVSFTSTQAIFTALRSGGPKGPYLSPTPMVGAAWTLSDTTGRGFGAVTVTNTSTRATLVSVAVNALGHSPTTSTLRLGAGQTASLISFTGSKNKLAHSTVQVRANSAVLVLAACAITTPRGIEPQSVLNGG